MHAAPVLVRNLTQDPPEVSNQGRRTPPSASNHQVVGREKQETSMFSSGNEVGTLALLWVGKVEGRLATTRRDREGVRRGVGGSEAGPTVHHHRFFFSIGTGARQFVPPFPGREAPRSMMSTRLRGPGKPAGGLLTAQRSLFRSRSSPCQQTSTPHVLDPLFQPFLPAPDGCLTTTSLAAGPGSGKRLH